MTTFSNLRSYSCHLCFVSASRREDSVQAVGLRCAVTARSVKLVSTRAECFSPRAARANWQFIACQPVDSDLRHVTGLSLSLLLAKRHCRPLKRRTFLKVTSVSGSCRQVSFDPRR
ncbi:hypothetical protein BaRGS_00034049, partial [Batillaria attramentaria]